jgi:cytochrome c556
MRRNGSVSAIPHGPPLVHVACQQRAEGTQSKMADDFDADEFLSELGVEENENNSHVVKALRKQLRELGKQLKDAKTSIESFEAEKVKTSLNGTWTELGVPEVLREDYHGEQTPEAVKTWWEARKGFFNLTDTSTTAETEESRQNTQDLQAVAHAGNIGRDQPGNTSLDAFKLKAAELSRSSPSKNPHALNDLLNEFGMKAGPMDFPTF